ncbi:MAG: SMI1/KNR4 family protein [Myxococcota bacterium]
MGRGDYDWILEVYSWPEQPEFLRGYVVRSRKTIEWCWPIEITCPKSHAHRVCIFKSRSEDFKDDVFVVLHDDGTFSETRNRDAALALAKGKLPPADAEVVADHVAADRKSQAFATSPIGLTFKRYLDALKRMQFVPKPRGPASAKAIQSLESTLGVPLPAVVRDLFYVADGEFETEGSLFGGYTILTLERIEQTLRDWAEIRRDKGMSLDARYSSDPPDAIRAEYSNPNWLPIAKEPLEPNYIGLDLAPGPVGTIEQIIPFGRDERKKTVLFPHLEAFIEWLANEAEQNRFRISAARELKYLEHIHGRLPEAIRKTRAS